MDAQTWEILEIVLLAIVAAVLLYGGAAYQLKAQNKKYMQGYLDGLKAERQSNRRNVK
jgi:high-affinity Fe2+/Pb2+ permease